VNHEHLLQKYTATFAASGRVLSHKSAALTTRPTAGPFEPWASPQSRKGERKDDVATKEFKGEEGVPFIGKAREKAGSSARNGGATARPGPPICG